MPRYREVLPDDMFQEAIDRRNEIQSIALRLLSLGCKSESESLFKKVGDMDRALDRVRRERREAGVG